MAVGLSIGDMLAIMQICYDVGAIIMGRSDAPKQFRRIQQVVYSFTESLKVLEPQIRDPSSVLSRADTGGKLKTLMSICQETLSQVQEIINRYEKSLDSGKGSGGFRASLHDNWKMIRWREEEAELAVLTQQLLLHQSAINSLANNAKQDDIVDALRKINLAGHSQCQHGCEKKKKKKEEEEEEESVPESAPLLAEKFPSSSQRGIITKRPNHPDGLPFVSAERCVRIDSWSFDVQISEEAENGKIVICPNARLKGSHFLAPQSTGKPREDLFQCNCRQWFGGRDSTGYHASVLNSYSCGPKTFTAQSFIDTSGSDCGAGWWLLQTAVKQGGSKNIFLELKDIEKRPQFAKIVASMLRTNVVINVLLGIIQPSDLVRWAKNGPKPHERLQIAWAYDERVIGKRGLKMRIEKLPWTEGIEFSDTNIDPDETTFHEEKVQDYFVKSHLPAFSWYRMAMFESINKNSFMETRDGEDAHFFLDHFHTSSEVRVKLRDPWNPNNIYWGVGEFGGTDVTYSSYADDGKPTEELMFTVSRFTVQKSDKDWRSPRSVNCSLHFTFRHGYSSAIPTLFTMWKRYEALSNFKGPIAELSQAGLEIPTKETPRFLMQIQNAAFTDISATTSLDPYDFSPTGTFRSCWLLGRKGQNRNSPLSLIIRSIEQDIHCHIYLSINDSRSLRSSANFLNRSISFGLFDNMPKTSNEEKKSWGWIYPRDPYGATAAPGFKICGLLKLCFSSESDLNSFLKNMERLLDVTVGTDAPPPPYREKPVLADANTTQPVIQASATLHHSVIAGQPKPEDVQTLSDKDLSPVWEKVHMPDGDVHYVESHTPICASDLRRRSKTFPSLSGSLISLKDRASSWPAGPLPDSEQLSIQQSHPPNATPEVTWEYHPPLYFAPPSPSPPPPPSPQQQQQYYYPQHRPLPNAGYSSHGGIPSQNHYQQLPLPNAYMVPGVRHSVHYTATAENRTNSPNSGNKRHPYAGWSDAGYIDYNQVPRGFIQPPTTSQNISPPLSPFSMSSSDFRTASHSIPTSNISLSPQIPAIYSPQQYQGPHSGVGSKRCVVVSGYDASPLHGGVSLQVGEVYSVVPQPNSPWVWIESEYGPSGFAPAGNFKDCY